MKPKFAELCRANPDAVFLMVNVGDHADIADRFKVSSMPAFRLIKFVDVRACQLVRRHNDRAAQVGRCR